MARVGAIHLPIVDPYNVPIFIQNFNQVSYLRKQIDWLLRAGYRRIVIVDNASDYPPLLQYYDEMTSANAVTVLRRPDKEGKLALWNERILARFGVSGQFVFTSSDVVPDECCPPNIVEHLAGILCEDTSIVKAGLGLRIDDVPHCYAFREEVLTWEGQFWRAPVAQGLFFAPIDTTFALYRSPAQFALTPAIRTGWPYLARHEPWYSDSANPSEEERNYAATIAQHRGHWGRTRLPDRLLAACAKLRSAPPVTLLHLACGHQITPGWINLDADPAVGPDIVFDLETCAERTMPFEAASVDGIFMCHTFGRLAGTAAMMSELYRVAKPNARFTLRFRPSPDFGSHEGLRESMSRAFACFAQPAQSPASSYLADWQLTRILLMVEPRAASTEGQTKLPDSRRGVVNEVLVELCAMKPARPRDPWLLEVPEPVITQSAIDLHSVF